MEQTIIPIELSGVNCYLGKEGENFILFDTAGHLIFDKTFTNRRETLVQVLDKHGCTSQNLKLIVLTHGDNDHVANALFLKEKYGTKIAMHKGDSYLVEAPTLENFMESFHDGPLSSRIAFKIIFKIMNKKIVKVIQNTLNDFQCFKADLFLEEGDSLESYGFNGKVICLPGHTPGSIAILLQDKKLIAGDTFQNNGKPGTALNAQNFDQLKESIKKLHTLGITTVYPGHGASFKYYL